MKTKRRADTVKRLFLALGLALAAGAGDARAETPAPGASGDAADSVLIESGRATYLRHCSACHGMEARGDGVLAPVLMTPPPDLTRIAARRDGAFPEEAIARFIDGRAFVAAHGSREMPVWGRVFANPVAEGTDAEEVVRGQLWVLVEYLKSIQRTAATKLPPVPPPTPATP